MLRPAKVHIDWWASTYILDSSQLSVKRIVYPKIGGSRVKMLPQARSHAKSLGKSKVPMEQALFQLKKEAGFWLQIKCTCSIVIQPSQADVKQGPRWEQEDTRLIHLLEQRLAITAWWLRLALMCLHAVCTVNVINSPLQAVKWIFIKHTCTH